MPNGAKPFKFDLNDFSSEALEAARKLRENAPPTFSQEQLEKARAEGHAQGMAEGKAEALTGIERDTAITLQALSGALERLAGSEDQRAAKMVDQATLMVFQVIEKLLPQLLDEHGANHIASFIHKTVQEHVKHGTLKVNVHPDKRSLIAEKLGALAEKYPKLGVIDLIDEPELDPQACRVAWAQGGADWNPNAIAASILDLFRTHLPETLETPHTESE